MDFKKFSKLILIEQTLFALPFAYLGVLFARGNTIKVWVLVTIALIAARTAGMSFNRVIDALIDEKNPRTSDRLVPAGEVSKKSVWLLGIFSSAALVLSAFFLNQLCFYLSFVAVFLLFSYSYFKRFSSSSHLYLGFVEAAAPIGGYLAVTGTFDLRPFVLGAAIMLWIAGLDMVYAIQDSDFDKTEGLFSIPSRYGIKTALVCSSMAYLLSIGALVAAGVLSGRSQPYWISVICVALIFFRQQQLARKEDIESAVLEFFSINKFVSPVLLFGTVMDIWFV